MNARMGLCTLAVLTAVNCAPKLAEVRESPRPLSVSWEFHRADKEEGPYTTATLVISGRSSHRHEAGEFYGRVRRVMSASEISRDMVGGTISGFITVNEGRGHEVIVRYNEDRQILVIAQREWREHMPLGSFRVVKIIPVPKLKQEETGF